MWQGEWRDAIWNKLDLPFDILIIGGGITGAGILRESVRLGLKTLLVEKRDFGWGTSSRSSKLVHGGLRYLKNMQFSLTRDSVRERERLIGEAPGLIDPLGFLLANYTGDSPGRWTFRAGLTVYDLLALHWTHRHYSADDFQKLAPHIKADGLEGGFRYGDAQTDDVRLVLRILAEAVQAGGQAINYVEATGLLLDNDENVSRARLYDHVNDRLTEVHARLVINATGAWADRLRRNLGVQSRIRPLRGSHLIFPAWRLPVAQAISFLHPLDRRPVFVFPWEGVTLVGTTDVDHHHDLDEEPRISVEEVSYLMAAVQHQFSPLDLQVGDVIATYSGIRPVIDTGKHDPSQESRDHVTWLENGLMTVTGGKLTTFRLVALDALKKARDRLPEIPDPGTHHPVLDPVDPSILTGANLNEAIRRRLIGRYGIRSIELVQASTKRELELIPGTTTLWAELKWAARSECVYHLDDLLLRRVRLGLVLPDGGKELLPAIKSLCQKELGWSSQRWRKEETAYLKLMEEYYAPPHPGSVPDWRPLAESARLSRQMKSARYQRFKLLVLASSLGLFAAAIAVYFFKSLRDQDRNNKK
ncbi:MAG: glycerol-3-phosphate dehydrogenase/oxidase [Anaerolineales bacterium]|nr:glycerol-3-phosphate dehydrogenase/oxidase [Anaerolineales bacterium]